MWKQGKSHDSVKDQSIHLKLPITGISSSIVQASTQARLTEDNTLYKCHFSVTDSWRQKKQLKVQDWRQSSADQPSILI